MDTRQKYKVKVNESKSVEIIHGRDKDYDREQTIFPVMNQRANVGKYEKFAQEIFFHLGYDVLNLHHSTLSELPETTAWFEKHDKKPLEAYKLVYRVAQALDENFIDDFSHPGIPDIVVFKMEDDEIRDIRFAEVKGWMGQLADHQEEWIERYNDEVPIDIIKVKELDSGMESESNIEDCELITDSLNQ